MEWSVADENGMVPSWERVAIAVLMDIRDELKRLNGLLHCRNFLAIPHKLDAIRRQLPKRRRRRKTA